MDKVNSPGCLYVVLHFYRETILLTSLMGDPIIQTAPYFHIDFLQPGKWIACDVYVLPQMRINSIDLCLCSTCNIENEFLALNALLKYFG